MKGESGNAEGARIVANAGWLYFDQALRAGAVMIAFSLMARSLGPEQFGWLSYAIAFGGVFLPLAMLGLDYVAMQDFVRHPHERDAIVATVVGLKAAGAGIGWGVTLLAAWLLPIDPGARGLIVVTSLSLLFQPLLALDYYFQSQVAAKYSSCARIAACLLANGLRVWFASRGAPVAWFAWAFVVEAALYGGGLWLAWRWTKGIDFPWRWSVGNGARARRMLQTAWPLFLADVAIVCYLRVDQVVLKHVAGAEELGRYAAAYRLADAAEFFALALVTSHFPRVVRLHVEGGDRFAREIERLFRRMTWVAVAIAVAVSVASPWITAIVLGASYGPVWPVLTLLTWANVFATQTAVRGKWFLLEGRQVASLLFFIGGAAVHLGLLMVLASRWGALGAAVSFAIAQFVIAVIAPGMLARTRSAAGLALRSFIPGRI